MGNPSLRLSEVLYWLSVGSHLLVVCWVTFTGCLWGHIYWLPLGVTFTGCLWGHIYWLPMGSHLLVAYGVTFTGCIWGHIYWLHMQGCIIFLLTRPIGQECGKDYSPLWHYDLPLRISTFKKNFLLYFAKHQVVLAH